VTAYQTPKIMGEKNRHTDKVPFGNEKENILVKEALLSRYSQ